MFKLIIISVLTLFNVDDTIINRIHSPYRLLLLDPHKQVTGIVKKVERCLDGDIEILLSVTDSSLLAKNNYTKEDGCLVLEIICACKSVFPICKDYQNKILIPSVGDTIMATGLFVYDKRHKINEIHPVLELYRK